MLHCRAHYPQIVANSNCLAYKFSIRLVITASPSSRVDLFNKLRAAAKVSAGGVGSLYELTRQSFTAKFTPRGTKPSTNYCSEDF